MGPRTRGLARRARDADRRLQQRPLRRRRPRRRDCRRWDRRALVRACPRPVAARLLPRARTCARGRPSGRPSPRSRGGRRSSHAPASRPARSKACSRVRDRPRPRRRRKRCRRRLAPRRDRRSCARARGARVLRGLYCAFHDADLRWARPRDRACRPRTALGVAIVDVACSYSRPITERARSVLRGRRDDAIQDVTSFATTNESQPQYDRVSCPVLCYLALGFSVDANVLIHGKRRAACGVWWSRGSDLEREHDLALGPRRGYDRAPRAMSSPSRWGRSAEFNVCSSLGSCSKAAAFAAGRTSPESRVVGHGRALRRSRLGEPRQRSGKGRRLPQPDGRWSRVRNPTRLATVEPVTVS